jgi:uncharacterized protein YifN (PemK superfamily)/uncharacterized membrane protein
LNKPTMSEFHKEAVSVNGLSSVSKMTEVKAFSAQELTDLKLIHSGGGSPSSLKSFRDLRTRLMALKDGGNFSCLVVSAETGGGSHVAANLAVAIALDKTKSSVLVDCNLYSPSVDQYMPGGSDVGLTDYLDDASVSCEDIVYGTGVNRMRAIPVGNNKDGGTEKFVKGDAVAGILIVAINIIGGLAIGIAQKGMTWTEALQTYTLLTVGDGFVTQIPSLIIAVATGIIITRAATDSKLSVEIFKQFTAHTKIFYILAFAMGGLLLLPGMPVFHVLIIIAIVVGIAFFVGRKQSQVKEEFNEIENIEESDGVEKVYDELSYSALELRVSKNISEYITSVGPAFEKRLNVLRKNVAKELGVVVPALTVKTVSDIADNNYSIQIWGEEYGDAEIFPQRILTINSKDNPVPVEGIESRIKRAATSATLCAPFVTTTNCTIIRIKNTTNPIT